MNAKATVLAGVLFLAFVAPSVAQSVPVMILWDDVMGFRRCGSSGEIKVNSFVSVRAGPGIHYRERDRVRNGQKLVLCDESNGWFAVVYVPGGNAFTNDKCWPGDPTKPKGRDIQYRGPCRSGWIKKNFVGNLAG